MRVLLMISRPAMLVAVLTLSLPPALLAQRQASPPPSGNRITAGDGDVVVVDHDARVHIVRTRQAFVRAVHHATEGWLLLLVDHERPGAPADGLVDYTYYFRDVAGAWPLQARWEGPATIEEYLTVGQSSAGLGIATREGLVQVLRLQEFRDAKAAAVLSSRSGAGSAGTIRKLTFDEGERWYSAELRRNDDVMRSPDGLTGSVSMTIPGGVTGGGVSRAPNGAVRVGGRVRPPVKVVDVPAVRPDVAVRANIRGIVVLEVTIDVDGTVKDAKVLRSVPALDPAALEAVRQWRYEPTIVDGTPVPIVMTVQVTF